MTLGKVAGHNKIVMVFKPPVPMKRFDVTLPEGVYATRVPSRNGRCKAAVVRPEEVGDDPIEQAAFFDNFGQLLGYKVVRAPKAESEAS
jgi:hypothetical protein